MSFGWKILRLFVQTDTDRKQSNWNYKKKFYMWFAYKCYPSSSWMGIQIEKHETTEKKKIHIIGINYIRFNKTENTNKATATHLRRVRIV